MSSFIASINELILRDLNKLEKEISAYPDEQSIWKIDSQITNSAGNLCLHLCGNLQHYFDAVLNNSGYVRNRDLEFSSRNVPRKKLLEEINKAKEAVSSTLATFPVERLEMDYPEKVFESTSMTTQHFFIHLSAHLGYHLGQINYHRRLLGTN
jgi:uncharacterized damage-inducible protein DinB